MTRRAPALDALEGRRVPGGCDDCNAHALLHRSVTPYRQADDPQSDQFERRDTVAPSTTTESAGNECVTVSRTSTWTRDTHTQPPSTVSGTHSGHTRDTVAHRDLCRGCGADLDDVDGTGLHPGCEAGR